MDRLISVIAQVWPSQPDTVRGIAVAAPGPSNPLLGIIYRAPNIPGWEEVQIVKILHERFNVPVFLGNDANLAALGELRYGAGKGHRDLLYMTISTGIGTGVVLDNHLLVGHHGLGMEMGHITVLPDGPMCGCGKRGHLEAVASGTAIARFVKEQIALGVPSSLSKLAEFSGYEITQAAEQGDRLAIEAYRQAGTYIGKAMGDFLHIFNPSIIVLGGGVTRSGKFLMEPMVAAMRDTILSPAYMEDLVITTAALGDDAGLIGALALAEASTNP